MVYRDMPPLPQCFFLERGHIVRGHIVAILSASYRARPEIRKNMKNYEIPHPGVGPENTKKLPKKYNMVIIGPFSYFFGSFCFLPNPG